VSSWGQVKGLYDEIGKDKFGKSFRDDFTGIVNPPFYATRLWPKVQHTMRGLHINSNAQVVHVDGYRIGGFYAAGEIAGGVHGGDRLGSCATLYCIAFGSICRSLGSIGVVAFARPNDIKHMKTNRTTFFVIMIRRNHTQMDIKLLATLAKIPQAPGFARLKALLENRAANVNDKLLDSLLLADTQRPLRSVLTPAVITNGDAVLALAMTFSHLV